MGIGLGREGRGPPRGYLNIHMSRPKYIPRPLNRRQTVVEFESRQHYNSVGIQSDFDSVTHLRQTPFRMGAHFGVL